MTAAGEAKGSAGRFVDVGALAEGGMATVSLAKDEAGGLVVVKRIRPELSWDPAYRHLFDDEGRVMALLDHPNIVGVRARGEDDHGAYLVLEHVDGTDLSRVLDASFAERRGLDVAVVLAVGVPLAEALAFAHEARADDGAPLGIVHRDVSPGNVLLSNDGDVKLADFGVAKSTLKTDATVAGEMKGKFAYMAPEQTRGDDVDARADLFALGTLLMEMLTGAKLFDGPSDADVVHAVRATDPPALARTDVPDELAALVRALLDKDRARRPASARDVARALRDIACACCVDQGMRRHVAHLARTHPRPVVAPVVVDDARRRTQRVVGAPGKKNGARAPRAAMFAATGVAALASLAIVATGARSVPDDAIEREASDDGVVATALDDDPPSPVSLPPMKVGGRVDQATLTTTTERAPDEVVSDARPVAREGGVRVASARAPTERAQRETSPSSTRAAPTTAAPTTAATTTTGTSGEKAGFGRLFLRTEPWAHVAVDGVATGEATPLVGFVIPSGKHTITLTNPHYGITKTLDVVVPSGGDVKHSLRLDER